MKCETNRIRLRERNYPASWPTPPCIPHDADQEWRVFGNRLDGLIRTRLNQNILLKHPRRLDDSRDACSQLVWQCGFYFRIHMWHVTLWTVTDRTINCGTRPRTEYRAVYQGIASTNCIPNLYSLDVNCDALHAVREPGVARFSKDLH